MGVGGGGWVEVVHGFYVGSRFYVGSAWSLHGVYMGSRGGKGREVDSDGGEEEEQEEEEQEEGQ